MATFLNRANQTEAAGVIVGHTHYPEDTDVCGIRYVNGGCWTDKPAHWVLVTHAKVTLESYG